MKTVTVTIKEYAALYGCSVKNVNIHINKGNLMTGMVSYRKSAGTWLIEVLKNWIENKTVS